MMSVNLDKSAFPEAKAECPGWRLYAALALVTLAALALRLYRLPDISLWYDEACSVLIARRPLGVMHRVLFQDVHPPLWYYCLHIWGADSVAWARGFSVFCGTITIPALFFLFRRPLGTGTALLAALLLAAHPAHVYYSQELRMYAFLDLLVVFLLALGIHIARAASSTPARHWVGLALLAAGIMLTQYLGGILAGGVWMGLLAAAIARDRRPKAGWLIHWIVSGAIPVLCIIPFLIWATHWPNVNKFEREFNILTHIFRDTMDAFFGHLRSTPWLYLTGEQSGQLKWDTVCGVGFLILLLAGNRALRRSNRRAEGIFLGTALAGCIFLFSLYQAAGMQFYTRYYVLLTPLFCLLAASGLAAIPRVYAMVLGILLGVCMVCNDYTVVHMEHRETMGKMVRHMLFLRRSGEIPPVFSDNLAGSLALRAYFPRADFRHRAKDSELIPVQRALLGVDSTDVWPEKWRGRIVWVVLSGWGNCPKTPEEADDRILNFLRQVGAPENVTVRFLHAETLVGGVKWSVLFEIAPRQL